MLSRRFFLDGLFTIGVVAVLIAAPPAEAMAATSETEAQNLASKPSQNRRRRFGPGTWWRRHPAEHRRSRDKPSQ